MKIGIAGSLQAAIDSHVRCSILELQVLAAAILTLVLLTTGLAIAGSWYDEQRGGVLILTSLLALVALVRCPRPSTPVALMLLGVAVSGIVSASLSLRPLLAAIEWANWILFLSILLLIRPSHPRSVARAASYFSIVVGGGYVIAVVSRYFSAIAVGFPVGADTLLVGVANPRFPAHLQMLTLPLIPVAFALCKSKQRRVLVSSIAVLWWMCFVGSGSRTGWLAVSVALFAASACGVEGRKLARRSVFWAVIGAVVYYLAFFVAPALGGFPTQPETGRLSEFGSGGTRKLLWVGAFQKALEHPVFGVGPMHFAYVYNGIAAHPHNFWMQIASEWGVAVTLLVVAATIWLLRRGYVNAQRSHAAEESDLGLAAAVFAALVAWTIGIQLDGLMVVPLSQLASLIVLALAVALLRPAVPVAEHWAGPWIVSTLILSAIATLSLLLFVPFGEASLREREWRTEQPAGALLLPRFWQQGWIGPDQDPSAR